MTPTLRAAIYARFSSEMQDSATIATQISECSVKAGSLGAIVVATYCDEALSGTNSDDRENFRKMLSDARQKPRPFDFVIVRKFDRFARNALDARMTEDTLGRNGIKLVSVMENFDDSTAGGWLSKQMMHLINEWYSRNLATETISGMITNTKKGFRCGGSAPYGYRNVKKTDPTTGKERTVLEPDPNESEAVLLIFRRYAEGAGQQTIIRELIDRGHLPRRSKHWNKSQISQMLSNETYRGCLIWRKTPDPSTWIRNEGGAPRLIDDETWTKVSSRLEINRDSRNTAISRAQHPLAGIVFCSRCGARYVLGQKQDGRFRLVCSSRKYRQTCENGRTVDEQTLSRKIVEVLIEKIFTRETIAAAVDELRREIAPDLERLRKDLESLEQKAADLAKRETAMVEELFRGDLPRDAVKTALEKTQKEKSGLLVRIREISSEIEKATSARIEDRDISDFLDLSREILRTATGPRLNSAFRDFGVRVEIDGEQGQISINPAIFGGVYAVSNGAGSRDQNDTAIRKILRRRFVLPPRRADMIYPGAQP